MRSTTTSADRCTFDAAGNGEKRVLVSCVTCGRSKMVSDMVKCDACHRFAHRRCILGGPNTDHRSGHLTVLAQVTCGEDRREVRADAATQTSLATCDVTSGDEKSYEDCFTRAIVATCHVACGDEILYVDRCSQHSEATCYVVAGEVTDPVDEVPRVGVATSRDATQKTVVAERSEEENLPSVRQPSALPTVSAITPSAHPESRASNENTRKSTLSRTLKYWNLRHSLFSKFDQGIMLDEVSMYSVCPEVLAEHMAKRCAFDIVLDPFCGAGGNAIQLAFTCAHVIAIDSDPNNIMLARRNAEIYGVADRIEFKVGDSYQMAAGLRVDAVVTLPPWGGLGYLRIATFDASYLGSRATGGMASVLKMVHAVAPMVVLHVPENIDRMQCLNMAAKHGFGLIQYESVTIDRKPNCSNLYLTRLFINNIGMANNLIISEFIEEYQKHPCLWNKSIEEYRNRVKREHAEELLLKFSKILTIKELRRKIRSIRCTYNQEVAKIKKSMVTGSCTNTVYKPKLAWFSLADSFLKKNHLNDNNVGANLILTSKKNSNLVEKCQENHENICHSLDISILGPEHSENIVSIATELPKNMNKRVSKLQPQKKTVKKCKLLNTLDNAVDALTFICTQQTSTENEFTIFGKQVGLQLQKLPLKEALELQNDIQQLLTRARLVSIKDINVPKTI